LLKKLAGRARAKLRRKFVACDKCEVPESNDSDDAYDERQPPLKYRTSVEVEDNEADHYDTQFLLNEIDKFCFCPPAKERER